jgi:nucleotide-binding universal stress UspA family protein
VQFAASILVPTDLSPASHAALNETARLLRFSPAKVTLLYVFDAGPWTLPPSVANRVSNPESTLRRMLEEANGAAYSVLLGLKERYLQGYPDIALRTLEHASAAQAISTCARDWGADLIVIASHGRTGPEASAAVGSVTEKVVRSAPCRVLVVPSRDPADFAH